MHFSLHLGDYIYEYGTGGAAINRTNFRETELASLDDYRLRYKQYRSDPDLAASHQNLPWIAVWDDHETANNDSVRSYPASYRLLNQIVVAASTQRDGLASYSNYGRTTVDLAAPGSNS